MSKYSNLEVNVRFIKFKMDFTRHVVSYSFRSDGGKLQLLLSQYVGVYFTSNTVTYLPISIEEILDREDIKEIVQTVLSANKKHLDFLNIDDETKKLIASAYPSDVLVYGQPW